MARRRRRTTRRRRSTSSRRANPRGRTITSQAQFRRLAAMMTRGEISKRDFDDMVRASRPFSRLPKYAPRRRKKKTMTRKRATRRRTRNFASGMRYIHNLPPGPRVTEWFAKNNPARALAVSVAYRRKSEAEAFARKLRRERRPKGYAGWHVVAVTGQLGGGRRYVVYALPIKRRETNPARRGDVRVTKDQRDLLNWMNRNGGISDGKITTQTPAVRRTLESMRKKGLVRKKGYTGKNARYTLTTKGFHALGKVKGVRVKRVSRRKKR